MKKKKILIVNCYFDELRIPIKRKAKMPQAMTPAFIAGVFSPALCEIKLYNEQYSGPLEDEKLLAWPDMLVLTGLNTSFDRMLHITAYTRTKNKQVIAVAGGPAIRALPQYSKRFFDYCCLGDIEQLREVIEDTFTKEYVSINFLEKGWVIPRYDLAYWTGIIGYVESSRNCYNSCNFCSLTGEGVKYRPYELEYLRQQFIAMGRHKYIMFLDNNFGSPDRQFVVDRFELLRELWHKKYFKGWGALVSPDFFLNDDYLDLARHAGGGLWFSGIESFDKKALLNLKKHQNIGFNQLEIIRKCLLEGFTFYYGIVFDVSSRSIADLREELEFIINNSEITLPCYISIAVPILGTPFFRECLEKGIILPNIKLRDMDSTTLTLKPHDHLYDVVQFIRDIQDLSKYRKDMIRQSKDFFLRYRNNLSYLLMLLSLYNGFLLCTPKLATAGSNISNIFNKNYKKPSRTFVGSTEPLDAVYTPAFRVDSAYEYYFTPTMLTDHDGNLSEVLHTDLLRIRS
jgi:hypothetical protein